MEGGDEGVEMVAETKDLQQQTKAFDKLTDRVEDRQLDSTRVQEAMASIAASAQADWNAMRLRFIDKLTGWQNDLQIRDILKNWGFMSTLVLLEGLFICLVMI
ncbi:uncharacterized protein LOC130973297 isoform X3 [Arachis stenosperma]|uniref:uncharacterized protein LOC130973297 isoform X3 n=1 Tax=Arachis stenosperma TaxID=217475 RepID=UPI0007893686|nr:uncharacterized protein LOC130973297 isoform X3 [Arachis stenosperma]